MPDENITNSTTTENVIIVEPAITTEGDIIDRTIIVLFAVCPRDIFFLSFPSNEAFFV